MNSVDLLRALDQTLTKTDVIRVAGAVSEAGSVHHLLDLTVNERPEVAFRAAWILEHLVLTAPSGSMLNVKDFMQRYPQQGNPGCRRHYARIMRHVLENEHISDGNLEAVMEATFEWLIDSRSPVAIKCNCLDVLYLLCKQFDWISAELQIQIGFLMETGSPAIRSRGKKILAYLKVVE